MWKFIGKTMASMVLTKEARDAAGGLAKNAVRNATQKMLPPGMAPLPEAPVPPPAPAPVISERAELIRRAMEVRAAKQTVLAELSEADRERLVATAMKAFLTESKPRE